MAAAQWKFIVTDLFYSPVGELKAVFDVNLTKPLNGLDSLSLRVREEEELFDLLESCECCIKVYRNDVLEFFGFVTDAEEVGDEAKTTLALTCASAGWIMERTHALHQIDEEVTRADSPVPKDRGTVLRTMIESAASAASSATPGDWPSYPLGCSTFLAYSDIVLPMTDEEHTAATVWSVLQTISNGSRGFDWIVVPVEPTPRGTSTIIGELVGAQIIGQDRPDVIFEYATGRHSLAGYQRVTTRSQQATHVYNELPVVYYLSDGSRLLTVEDDRSLPDRNRWGELSASVAMDVTAPEQRTTLLAEALRLRKEPRKRLSITPRASMGASTDPPQWRTDYGLGDRFKVRIAGSKGVRFESTVRLYAVSFELADGSSEKMGLTITEES